jgi:hypothetical protein
MDNLNMAEAVFVSTRGEYRKILKASTELT